MKWDESDTKKKLIQVARRLFSAQKYESVSVRMLCEEAGTNVSSVSYHFGGKEELYRACLVAHGKSLHSILTGTLSEPRTVEECKLNLQNYITGIIENSVIDSDSIKIMIRELDANLKIAEDIFKDLYIKLGDEFQSYIKKSQSLGFIRKDISPDFLDRFIHTQSFLGIKFSDMNNKLGRGDLFDKEYRDNLVDQMMKIFVNGIFISKG